MVAVADQYRMALVYIARVAQILQRMQRLLLKAYRCIDGEADTPQFAKPHLCLRRSIGCGMTAEQDQCTRLLPEEFGRLRKAHSVFNVDLTIGGSFSENETFTAGRGVVVCLPGSTVNMDKTWQYQQTGTDNQQQTGQHQHLQAIPVEPVRMS